ncbi:MAG: hypothetical protein HXX11_08810 [Desulfuromonadales bacterium]|nr:hypothetical protein [Desulfuromonadales bacterium]
MNMDDMQKEMVLLEDAAVELSTTGMRLLMLIREGTLAGSEADGEWSISRESLERLKCTGLTPPETKGCAKACSATKCGQH